MNPKLFRVQAQRGCYSEGCLEVDDSLLYLALGGAYLTKEAVESARFYKRQFGAVKECGLSVMSRLGRARE